MYLLSVVLLAILTIANAKIAINIEAGRNLSDILISYSGSDEAAIGEKEIEMFNIDTFNLKRAVRNKYEETPRDVFLKGPTPWGDLYEKYQWRPVTRVMKVKSVVVKDKSMKSMLVLSQNFENSSNNTIKVNAGISQTVENTVSTTWSVTKETSVTQEIEYDLNVILAKVSGTTSFTYSSSVGKSEEKSETITLGTSSSMETELKPGQAATAVLSANRCKLEIEIQYALTLRGNVAVNFRKRHRGHHFYGPSIESVLRSGNLQTEVVYVENVEIGLYTDASLKVFDKESGATL